MYTSDEQGTSAVGASAVSDLDGVDSTSLNGVFVQRNERRDPWKVCGDELDTCLNSCGGEVSGGRHASHTHRLQEVLCLDDLFGGTTAT